MIEKEVKLYGEITMSETEDKKKVKIQIDKVGLLLIFSGAVAMLC